MRKLSVRLFNSQVPNKCWSPVPRWRVPPDHRDTPCLCTVWTTLSQTPWAEMPQAVAVHEGSLLSLPGCSALQLPIKTLRGQLSSVCSCPRDTSWSPHTSQGRCAAAATGSAKNPASPSSLLLQTGLHFSSKPKWS